MFSSYFVLNGIAFVYTAAEKIISFSGFTIYWYVFQYHHIRTLSWQAQSPDLNPIKNLWNVIKRKIEGSTGSGGRAVDCVVVVVA